MSLQAGAEATGSTLKVPVQQDKPRQKAAASRGIPLAKSRGAVWAVLFAWVMCDTLVLYLIRPWFAFPINTLLPLLVLLAFLVEERGRFSLPRGTVPWMGCILIGYALAVTAGNEELSAFIRDPVKILCAFIIGYFAVARPQNHRLLLNLIVVVGCLYVLVCTLALLGVSQKYLPVVYAEGFIKGVPVRRAEVTTDQNYQVFFLFPVMIGLAVQTKAWKLLVLLVGAVGALFIILKLQSRSGLILLGLSALGGLLLPWWYGRPGSTKRLILALIAIAAAVSYQLAQIIAISEGIVRRFVDTDLGTFWGRVESNMYLVRHLLEPSYWLPRGADVFTDVYGNLPHSSPTLIFLQAGILGLAGWVMLVLVPLVRGLLQVRGRRGSLYLSAIILGGLVSWLGAMTLPAAFYGQAWLWAGATAGAVYVGTLRRPPRPVAAT